MSAPTPVDALIMQVRTQAESEFAAPFIAEIEKLIGSLRDFQPNAAPQPTRAKSTQHYPLSKVASHWSSAEMKRERDVAIVRGALTENWQETNWIYQKAREDGFVTSAANCHKLLRDLRAAGLVEMDPDCSRQRWRNVSLD